MTYDEDKFLFSHHATDPCGGQLVNAWDLVRIHKFGDRDDEALPGTTGISLPSYKAMAELARQDPTVGGRLADERWRKAQEAFQPVADQEPAEGAEEADDGAWRRPPIMALNGQGTPEKSVKNYRTALENDPKLKGRLRLNLFSGRCGGDAAVDSPGEFQSVER